MARAQLCHRIIVSSIVSSLRGPAYSGARARRPCGADGGHGVIRVLANGLQMEPQAALTHG